MEILKPEQIVPGGETTGAMPQTLPSIAPEPPIPQPE
jgi:hypothetical protein